MITGLHGNPFFLVFTPFWAGQCVNIYCFIVNFCKCIVEYSFCLVKSHTWVNFVTKRTFNSPEKSTESRMQTVTPVKRPKAVKQRQHKYPEVWILNPNG